MVQKKAGHKRDGKRLSKKTGWQKGLEEVMLKTMIYGSLAAKLDPNYT